MLYNRKIGNFLKKVYHKPFKVPLKTFKPFARKLSSLYWKESFSYLFIMFYSAQKFIYSLWIMY